MNLRRTLLISAALWASCLGADPRAAEAPAEAQARRVWLEGALERSLEANRAILVRLKRERRQLASSLGAGGSLRQLRDLDVKISALEADRSNLLVFLEEEEQAREFLKDLEADAPLLPGSSTPVVPAKPVDTDDLYLMHEMALERVSQERYPEALRLYQEIILHDPGDDEAYLLMGHIYMLLNHYGKAETAFLNAVDIDPSNADEIVPFYENLVLRTPNDDAAYTHLGFAYLILGLLEQAGVAFENALSINPDNPLAAKGMQMARRQFGG